MGLLTVTPPDDDEVIIAGDTSDEGTDRDSEQRVEVEPETSSQSTPAIAPQPEPTPQPPSQPAVTASVPRKTSDGKPSDYRETTLDDLDSQPMPLVQKIVIIAAVVCIIGAIVYYFAVMR